jgi:hypothetical protein
MTFSTVISRVTGARSVEFPISNSSSDGRRNTALIGWFHNSLQKGTHLPGRPQLHLDRAVFANADSKKTSLASETPALRLRARVASTH